MRNEKGQFIKGHVTKEGWGFSKENQLSLKRVYKKGVRNSINTEFKKGKIPWNIGIPATLAQKEKMVKNHKGMTGLKHSEETKIKLSLQRMGIKLPFKVKKNMSIAKAKYIMEHPSYKLGGNRSKSGYREINGRKQYFRSSWEANTARLLDFQGRKWEFEKKTFWFENIRRGTRSYLPDFYLPEEDLYIEVKGYMDSKSITKLKRMDKYYPEVNIEVWGKEFFADLKKQGIGKLIPGWE